MQDTDARAPQDVVLGVDVGGTRIKSALVARDGTVWAQDARPTPADIGTRLGSVVADLLADVRTDHLVPPGRSGRSGRGDAPRPVALGVVVPGLVDERAGIGVWSANLDWQDLDVRGVVAAGVDLPVTVGHDVRAGLLAEHRLGAARGHDDVLFIPIGTGIASAMLTQGRLVHGSVWTGEIGHIIVDPDGPPCGCGQRGCLEAIAGAAAIGRRWAESNGRVGDAEEVARRAAAGEAGAASVWAEAIEALSGVIAPIIAAAGTELLLVGGGLARASDLLILPLRTRVAARLGGRAVEVATAALGDRAGALGAATIAWDAIDR